MIAFTGLKRIIGPQSISRQKTADRKQKTKATSETIHQIAAIQEISLEKGVIILLRVSTIAQPRP
jgi:hypothetical protein